LDAPLLEHNIILIFLFYIMCFKNT